MNSAYEAWKRVPNVREPELTVVIPAYNEARRIVPTIGAIAAHLCTLELVWDMIVVDDKSTDPTAELVEGFQFANVTVLRQPRNQGKGAAVRAGVLAAKGEYVLFADADQSTPIEQIAKLLDPVRDGRCDLAIASRAADGADVGNKSMLRHLLSNVLRLLVRHGLGMSVHDSQCGFKLFSRTAAQALFRTQRIDGFSFDLEVLYIAHREGLRIHEVGVQWIDAPGSTVDPIADTARFLTDILAIRRNAAKGSYALA